VRAEHLQQTVKYLKKCFGGSFSVSGSGSLLSIDGMANSSKYIEILNFIIPADLYRW
jgi:hypothetical protein